MIGLLILAALPVAMIVIGKSVSILKGLRASKTFRPVSTLYWPQNYFIPGSIYCFTGLRVD